MIDPETYRQIEADDFIKHTKCEECGHPALMFPFGNHDLHRCTECGSKKTFRQIREELHVKYGIV